MTMYLIKYINTIIFVSLFFILPDASIVAKEQQQNTSVEITIDRAIEEINKRRETINKNKTNLQNFFSSEEYLKLKTEKNTVIDISNFIEDALIPLNAFGEQDHLIFAFSPHHYHTFLVAGDFEFHGLIYPGKGYYRNVRDQAFRSSLFVKFPIQDPEDIVRTKRYIKLMHGHKSELCFYASLEILARGSNILLNKKKVHSLSGLVKAIVNKGFIDGKGKPVPVQIFSAYHKDIATMTKEMRKTEILYLIPGFFGFFGAKVGRISKNKSKDFLKTEDFFLHSRFPIRHPK